MQSYFIAYNGVGTTDRGKKYIKIREIFISSSNKIIRQLFVEPNGIHFVFVGKQ